MIWLTSLLIYVINIQGELDFCKVQKVFFLENDFWHDQLHLKTKNGYLYDVSVELGCKTCGYAVDLLSYSKNCYILKFNNLGYVVLRNLIINNNNYVCNSPENNKSFLRFRFLFTDEPFSNSQDNKNYEGRVQEFLTYKFPEEILENKNNIELGNDLSIMTRLRHVKDRFKGFICLKLLKFDEYIKFLDENNLIETEDGADFDLYYFECYSECIENLENFIKDLSYLKLIKNDDYYSLKTAIKVWEFRKHLFESFFSTFKELYGIETDKNWENLFYEYFDFLKDEILNNNIFLPLVGKYTINYYIEQLSNIIHKIVWKIRNEYAIGNYKYKDIFYSRIAYSLQCDLEKLQFSGVKALYETEGFPYHFSELLGREIKKLDDYIELEKIMCDYHNMFVYISNLCHKFNKKSFGSYFYVSPNLIDEYNVNIVYGIEIENTHSAMAMEIKGFDDKGKGVSLVKDIDYFINEFGKLYCPSKILEWKNIQEIEVILFSKEKHIMRFKVSEYLKIS